MNVLAFSPLTWIIVTSLLGGLLSVGIAAFFALNIQRIRIPMLVSYAIGTLLGAVFLELLPHTLELSNNPKAMSGTILFGILLFFTLEKLVLWRHCHGDHCEAHAIHDAEHCPDNDSHHDHNGHAHDHNDRSGMMIMIGDTFHNFVDGVLIAAAFLVDIKLGLVTALAIIAHEIPQEVGDFLILLHSGYSKAKALWFNLVSSFAMLAGGLLGYFFLQTLASWTPYILSLAVASMLYVAVADLIPGLHKRTEIRETIQQVSLIVFGVLTVMFFHHLFE